MIIFLNLPKTTQQFPNLILCIMKKLVVLLIFSLFLSFRLIAQQTVTGQITDENKNPVEGTTISVKGTEINVLSDKSGNYEIEIPEGQKVLSFQKIGFNV